MESESDGLFDIPAPIYNVVDLKLDSNFAHNPLLYFVYVICLSNQIIYMLCLVLKLENKDRNIPDTKPR